MRPVPVQHDTATVGDTIWISRTVDLPPGRSLRAADWEAEDPVELLGPARVILREGSAEIAYPVAVWRTGSHTVDVPGPLLLAPDGGVDSLAEQTVTLQVASVLPRPATDTTLQPQPRAEFVPQPATTPWPVLIFLLLAIAILAPIHWWWRRRGTPGRKPAVAEAAGNARAPLERWADAGESRAVAAAATARLRHAVEARLPGALTSLDTEAVLDHVARQRPDWPVAELGLVLRGLDQARFGIGTLPDALQLARRAADLEPRLSREAA
jgi:hypothetical protein